MKKILFLFAFTLVFWTAVAQAPLDQKFSKIALETDLNFIQSQLFNAHANPFTELDSLAYVARFKTALSSLRDSMTAFDLIKIAKPLFSPLSDEHAGISINMDNSSLRDAKVFLPFSLQKTGTEYIVKTILSTDSNLSVGDTLLAIEGQPIEEVIRHCADYTTGFPEQRMSKATAQIYRTYIFAYPNKPVYQIKTSGREVAAKGVGIRQWTDYTAHNSGKSACDDLISYKSFNKVGYINYCSFNAGPDSVFYQLEQKIAGIFKQIKQEKIETLIVDVSNNSGGNSACGDLLINYITTKEYKGYQCKWKRSDEYLALTKSWNAVNEDYQRTPVGSTISYKSHTRVPTRRLKNRFKGKVYVVVGSNTFSSAIMFATIVKDNQLALLAGQIPENGHPNHFGEMYGNKTPNTNLRFQFGVKEWIRPSGVRTDNRLMPDKMVDLEGVEKVSDLIGRILR